jgi:hypothetical protein
MIQFLSLRGGGEGEAVAEIASIKQELAHYLLWILWVACLLAFFWPPLCLSCNGFDHPGLGALAGPDSAALRVEPCGSAAGFHFLTERVILYSN